MKNFISFVLLATIACVNNVKASIITVNNNTTSPGQYTSLQAAITAAHSGDTILVSGSNTDYASSATITINKPVTLLGTGYNPIKDNPFVSKIANIDLQAGSDGTVIAGFLITGNLGSDNTPIANVTVKRNFLNYLNDANGNGWVLQENVFGENGQGFSVNGNNIVVKNNVIQGTIYVAIGNQASNTNFIVTNNIFFSNIGSSNVFYNAVVSNNIFYDSNKVSVNYAATQSANSTFTNNIVYGDPATNPLDTGVNGNTGSGNKYNTALTATPAVATSITRTQCLPM
jgi:hypothetical protein